MRRTSTGPDKKGPVARTSEGCYSKFSAARSDALNDEYMNRYAEAMESLAIGTSGTRQVGASRQVSRTVSTSAPPVAARGGRVATQSRTDASRLPAKATAQGPTRSRQVAPAGSNLSTGIRRVSAGGGPGNRNDKSLPNKSLRKASDAEAGSKGGRRVSGPSIPEVAIQSLSQGPLLTSSGGDGGSQPLGQSWWEGPVDPAGTVVKLTDQPILCMSVWSREVVVGSSDHALYTVDIHSGKPGQTLYGRAGGHTEWVTCVAHTCDGRVASGGMDGKICLWDCTGGRSQDLLGHTGSVSVIQTSADGKLLVSAGYDKTLRMWDASAGSGRRGGGGREMASLAALSAPVLALAWGVGGQVSNALLLG